MKLSIYKRNLEKKGEKKKIRVLGGIPAVVYANGIENKNIYIKKDEFEKLLKQIPKGRLSTAIFTLQDENETFKVIIKDLQYHVTTYNLEHIDFLIINEKSPVVLNVPIELTAAEECVGVKQGGTLRSVIRKLKVKCLPKDIPSHFEINVKDMQLGEDKKLKEIDIPKDIKPLDKMNEVAVIVAKR